MSEFFMPVRYFFGKNCLQKYSKALAQWGSPLLIITGKSSRINGSLDQLIAELNQHGITHQVVDTLSPNPRTDELSSIGETHRGENYKAIIGLGGGSYIDAAKALALMLATGIPAESLFDAAQRIRALPIIAIPTTSGTGSEVTQYCVLNDVTHHRKSGFGDALLFPKLSFLDPSFTVTLPLEVTRDTTLDALSHLLEGIYSQNRNLTIYPLIIDGIRRIKENLPECEADSQAWSVRESLMQASLYGGITIAQSSTTLQHSIGYPLTYHLGVPHGRANAMVMPLIIEFYSPAILPLLLEILQAAGFHSLHNFYYWLEKRDINFQCPGLNRLNLEELVETTFLARNTFLSPVPVTKKNLLVLYQKLAGRDT